MSIFWLEFAHYLAASLAILVSASATALFLVTFRYERTMNTIWRILGFASLAMAFLLLVLERKEPSVAIIATLFQAFALFCIYKGVLAEPKLVHLWRVPTGTQPAGGTGSILKQYGAVRKKTTITIIIVVAAVALFLLPGYLYIRAYLPVIIEAVALAFIIATIVLQVRRLKAGKGTPEEHRINMYPLVGFIFLAVRGLAMIFYRLPDLDVVILRKLSLEYSIAWEIGVFATIAAFVFLGIWAWGFVRVRDFLRTYVTFISIVIFVSALGALIFTSFIFKVIERNNLDLMLKGADTEAVIMSDRANTALFIARLVAKDEDLLNDVKNNNYGGIIDRTQDYMDSADADILRIYNVFGEVVASPSDPRDRGRVFSDDKLVTYALLERKQVRTFDSYPGVLADVIVARAIHPLIINNSLIGAIEVGYKFDNAFVDFSKAETNLDVTIYTANKISATTILTADGVSRFVGSDETDKEINTNVLTNGVNYSASIDRFGEVYYSAFRPIRDVNGIIIGMVAVGTPTYVLMEATRQQLVTTFILISVLSAIVSLIGYYTMPYALAKRRGFKNKTLSNTL